MSKTRNNRKPNFRQTKRKRGGGVGTSTHKSAPFNTTNLAAAVSRRQAAEEKDKAAQKTKQSAMYQSFAADAEKKKKEDAAKKEEEEAKKKTKEQSAKARNARKKSAKLQKKAISTLHPIPETPKSSEPPPTTKSPSPSQSLAALPPKSESPSLVELPPPPPPTVTASSKKEKTPEKKLKRALQLLAKELETTKNTDTCDLVKDVFYIDEGEPDPILQENLCKCFFVLGRVSYILEDLNYKFMLVLKGTRAMLLAAKKRDDVVARLNSEPGYNKLFKTVDIDGTLQLRDGVETYDSIEERKTLANEIFLLIQKSIGADELPILQPLPETPLEAKVVKLSYKNPDGKITAISDLGFSQIASSYYTNEFQETDDKDHKLHYRFPSLEDQKKEKEAFLDNTDKPIYKIKKFVTNLNKIRALLGEEPITMPSAQSTEQLERHKNKLQTKKAGLERLLKGQKDEEKKKFIVEQLEIINQQLEESS
jgi:hypothetical protein